MSERAQFKDYMARSAYQTRVVRQMILWVNGVNVHNNVDNECTPDFSCCVKDLNTPSLEDRQEQLNRYLRKLSLRS